MKQLEIIEYSYRRTYGIATHRIIYWRVDKSYCSEHLYLQNGKISVRDANWHRHGKAWYQKDLEFWKRHAATHNGQDYR